MPAGSKIGVVMGSRSDWDTMRSACEVLDELHVPYEARVLSAHRMPDEMFAYAQSARERGLKLLIAGAGGAAHLPGMLAAKTTLPVLGVPVATRHLGGQDSLYSIVQMPKGVPVATFAIGGISSSLPTDGLISHVRRREPPPPQQKLVAMQRRMSPVRPCFALRGHSGSAISARHSPTMSALPSAIAASDCSGVWMRALTMIGSPLANGFTCDCMSTYVTGG